MRVVKVKNKRQREKLERLFLKRNRVIAVVDDPKHIGDEFTKRADLVILEEKKHKAEV